MSPPTPLALPLEDATREPLLLATAATAGASPGRCTIISAMRRLALGSTPTIRTYSPAYSAKKPFSSFKMADSVVPVKVTPVCQAAERNRRASAYSVVTRPPWAKIPRT